MTTDGSKLIKSDLIELNNNETLLTSQDLTLKSKAKGEGKKSVFQNKLEKQRSLQEIFDFDDTNIDKKVPFQRGRSNSDGAAIFLADDAFPSLPNSVLEKLGLYGEGSTRESLNGESLEQKFTSLSLAFTIDAATVKDRCERQRRNRDQTESNFNLEVEKLKDKLSLLKPLCTDFETADLLSILFSQVDTLTSAVSLVSIAAERYGAVQHEERLTESVQLMVTHVQALKQQRDSAFRQLQYTKRVLQEPVQPLSSQKSSTNKILVSKRRSSTDSVNFNGSNLDQTIKLNRRISDLSFRAVLGKNRQSRLDLGSELNKIKEVYVDEGAKEESSTVPGIPASEINKDDIDSDYELTGQLNTANEKSQFDDAIAKLPNVIKLMFWSYLEEIRNKLVLLFNKWSENGYLHVFLNSCAILCFLVSILTLARIFLEQEYTKSSTHWLYSWIIKN